MERDKEEYSFAHQDGKRSRKGPLFGGARLTIEPGSDFPIGVILRQQLRGRFHDVCEAVADLRKKTIPASSLVENLSSRLRGYFCRRRQWVADDLS